MIYGIDLGHALNTGANKILNETTCNREIGNRLIKMLQEKGHTVINCTSENGIVESQLYDIVKKANSQKLDQFVSIHFNASNGSGNGTECYVYSSSYTGKDKDVKLAKTLTDSLSKLGFKNRGVKYSNSYVIKNTIAPAVLLEVCFIDNKYDTDTYKKVGVEKISSSIFKALTGVDYVKEVQEDKPVALGGTGTAWYNNYLNLKPHVSTWRVYPLNASPVVGNECGYLSPRQYGGLSYRIYDSPQKDVYNIKTSAFGYVKIYAPRDNDSIITQSPLY